MMILLVDQAGNPTKWIPPKDAALLIATGKVGWDIGDDVVVLRGGHGKDGVQSTLAIKPILAAAGSARMTAMLRHDLPLGDQNHLLFGRDRYTCAYCGGVYKHAALSRDHVLARSRGGKDSWMNCVTACKGCNQAKGSLLVDDFGPLLYVPYVPCRNEHFILQGRNILIDQMAYLSANLPAHSRLL
jgi:hypothetical protein